MNSSRLFLPRSLTRRNFLQTSSTSAAGLALLGGLSLERAAHAAGDDTLKIALVGCGGRGSGAVNEALNAPGNTKLVAVADPFPKQMEKSVANLKEQHPEKVDVPLERQFGGMDGFKQAIAAADVVFLASPPGFRPQHFEAAVQAGKHAFLEKPVATDAPGIRRLLAANIEAKKKGLKVAVGFQRRHKPNYMEAVKRIQDGAIGELLMLRVYWRGGARGGLSRLPGESEMAYQLRNWYFYTWLSGDHIVEQHCHNIDVANWIKGAYPVRAHGIGGRQMRTGKEYGQIFDHHFVEFEYADGTRLFSESSQIPHFWTTITEHAVGTKGKADLKDDRSVITGASPWKYAGENVNGWQQEQTDFIANIRNNVACNELDYAAPSTLTAIMGRMATYSGQMVELEEASKSQLALVPENPRWEDTPPVVPDADGYYPVAQPGIKPAW